jgi:hypothetical protein
MNVGMMSYVNHIVLYTRIQPPTRIYLDTVTLRNFINPLIKMSVTEFKMGLAKGGNFHNMGLEIAQMADKLIYAVNRMDCLVRRRIMYTMQLASVNVGLLSACRWMQLILQSPL